MTKSTRWGGAFRAIFSGHAEVLDPEQNATFRDNYLAVPFDLSRVLFIATANMLDGVPGPLQDRMEIISLPGYTEDEKFEIARRYLFPRQLEANGLKPEQAEITPEALRILINSARRRRLFPHSAVRSPPTVRRQTGSCRSTIKTRKAARHRTSRCRCAPCFKAESLHTQRQRALMT
jgi:hypothetical protein